MKYVLAVLLALVPALALAEASSNIEGFDDFALRASTADLSRVIACQDLSKTGGKPGWICGDDFAIQGISQRIAIWIFPLAGAIEHVLVDWPRLRNSPTFDLDSAAFVAKGLHRMLLDKYDTDLVKADSFGEKPFQGRLHLEDAEGDVLLLNWDLYDVSLDYSSKVYREALAEKARKSDQGSKGRL